MRMTERMPPDTAEAPSRERAQAGEARAPTIHTALRHETAELHHALDARLDLLAPELSMERYRAVLGTLLGYYAPLEERLVRAAASSPLALPPRARSTLLRRDLVALGASQAEIAALPRCDALPALSDLPHVAGCTYVLEGACLGGQLVARSLHGRFGLTKESGCAYFIGDAEHTGSRWRTALVWLEQVALLTGRGADMVASARATFQTLAQWIDSRGALR
jgi:heme oxygenase